MQATTTKVINVQVSPEIHQAAKILCAQKGITQARLIELLIVQAAGGNK